MGYANEDLEKIYGRNKMRVYREVWEGVAPEDDPVDPDERAEYIDDLRKRFQSR
jgi:membrane dipeptidase